MSISSSEQNKNEDKISPEGLSPDDQEGNINQNSKDNIFFNNIENNHKIIPQMNPENNNDEIIQSPVNFNSNLSDLEKSNTNGNSQGMIENQINSNDTYSQEIQNNSTDNSSKKNNFDVEEQN